MDAKLREEVWSRAQFRCEYCHMPQALDLAPFQIDHIIAEQHGSLTVSVNLALACLHCNKHKGPNISGLDPLTGLLTRLFDPRLDTWDGHFRWNGPERKAEERLLALVREAGADGPAGPRFAARSPNGLPDAAQSFCRRRCNCWSAWRASSKETCGFS